MSAWHYDFIKAKEPYERVVMLNKILLYSWGTLSENRADPQCPYIYTLSYLAKLHWLALVTW